ncbi:thiosulfate oxidation carrier protein SoxY [Rhodoblastus acidophilus]|uniref:Thiosulfate oxidation carrier protein SoxY n=1 Tax=Rhodoblastus acidophilus TaxID=1074 RepID=A0A6N8DHH7_RHOAC|nr:thiosulfate oxidation carrier protein SoxY [Rhodoblastus acidophilus]MCW2272841.1 sulfur-oxidizing protein SoxY [Rhodoblastus acidophilus]MTV29749.1 thiosulfate oxidation carrier protein SoxY [Rhodoblastus acidophilus]
MMLASQDRRGFLRHTGLFGLAISALTFLPRMAHAAWNKPAFDAKTMADAYKAMGVENPTASADVTLVASDIAENGAVVPVQAISKIPNTTQISFLVEKNPNMLAAAFDIGPDMLADVTTRIKMGQTSNVIALVKADGKYFTAAKEIKVTLGGCGG